MVEALCVIVCESKHNTVQLRLGDPKLLVSNHHQVFTSVKVNKGKLLLLPMGTLQLLPMDKIQKHHCIIRCTDLDKQVLQVRLCKRNWLVLSILDGQSRKQCR